MVSRAVNSQLHVCFGENFELDVPAYELRSRGIPLKLKPIPMELLIFLVERAGELVTRDQIVERIWGRDVYLDTDNSINGAISKIRQILRDDSENPRFVLTVPGKGYRFIASLTVARSKEPASASSSETSGGNLIGKKVSHYRILELLGGGGMGVVYKAEDLKLGRRVAIKFLPEELADDPKVFSRFEMEARTASSLDHRNICSIYQLGEYEGRPFIVMQLLEGRTLREWIGSAGRAPQRIQEMLNLGIQIADGLDAAHQKGIIHRDIKPANIFVTSGGEAKILDFGVAKLLAVSEGKATTAPSGETGAVHLTRTGASMGTPSYLSPEQIRGEVLDVRTDLFSFGLVLYEMASGQRAFVGNTVSVIREAVLNQQAVSVREFDAEVPSALEKIINKCIEKDRKLRYQSASEIKAELEEIRSDVIPEPEIAHGLRWLPVVAILGVIVLAAAWALRKHHANSTIEITQRQLTASATDNPITGAAISADGKYAAYSDHTGISIQDITDGDVHYLSATKGLDLADWYPDGLHLLATDASRNLWVLFAFSEERHQLASQVTAACMSPDGSQILLLRGQPFVRELWAMPAAGGEPRLLFSLKEPEDFINAGWSPDGKAIVDLRRVNGTGLLEIRSLVDGKMKPLLSDRKLIGGGYNVVYWLPDGRILFGLFKDTVTETDLWALSLDSSDKPVGKPTRVTNTTGSYIGAVSVSHDGRRMVIVPTRSPFSVFVAGLDQASEKLEKPVRLTNDSWNNWPWAWSADSQTLFYVSSRNKIGLYKSRLSSNSPELMTSGLGYTSATVTPDNAWLLYIATDTQTRKNELVRIPVSGGSPKTVLTTSDRADVACSRSGSQICVLAERVDKQQIYSLVDPMRGRLSELGRHDGDPFWGLSPDGTKIAIVPYSEDRVEILDLKSKQIREIRPVPPQTALQIPVWSADGRRLFLTAFPNDRGRLLEMEMNGHTNLLLQNPTGWIGYPTASPDGKHLAYIYVAEESNVTLLEHF